MDTHSLHRRVTVTERISAAERSEALVPFGDRVRALREERGLSQKEVDSRMGMTGRYVGGIERGVRNIGLINVLRLARALEVSPRDLL